MNSKPCKQVNMLLTGILCFLSVILEITMGTGDRNRSIERRELAQTEGAAIKKLIREEGKEKAKGQTSVKEEGEEINKSND